MPSLTTRASVRDAQMRADTLAGTNARTGAQACARTRPVLTGWRPRSQNTDMQVDKLHGETEVGRDGGGGGHGWRRGEHMEE